MAVLKLWVEPTLHQLTGVFDTPGQPPVTIEVVACTLDGNERQFTLLSLRLEGLGIDGDHSQAWRTLHDAYQLIAFAGNSMSRVVASRVEPDGVVPGQPFECEWYPGPPPSLATLHLPFGLPSSERLVWRGVEASDEARAAIGWYLRALHATDPFDRLVLLWTVLESLTPQISRPATCPKCQATLACPQCGPAPSTPSVLRSILALCEQLSGVTPKEVRDLYGVRSAIVHGRVQLDFAASTVASKGLLRVWEIAHMALKRALNWSNPLPPLINFRAGYGGNSMRMRGLLDYPTLEYWKHPICVELTHFQFRVPQVGPPGMTPTLPSAPNRA